MKANFGYTKTKLTSRTHFVKLRGKENIYVTIPQENKEHGHTEYYITNIAKIEPSINLDGYTEYLMAKDNDLDIVSVSNDVDFKNCWNRLDINLDNEEIEILRNAMNTFKFTECLVAVNRFRMGAFENNRTLSLSPVNDREFEAMATIVLPKTQKDKFKNLIKINWLYLKLEEDKLLFNVIYNFE